MQFKKFQGIQILQTNLEFLLVFKYFGYSFFWNRLFVHLSIQQLFYFTHHDPGLVKSNVSHCSLLAIYFPFGVHAILSSIINVNWNQVLPFQ